MNKATLTGIALIVVGSIATVSPAFAAPFSGGPGTPVVAGPDSGKWYWQDLSALSMFSAFSNTWDRSGDSDTWNSTNSALTGSDNTTSEALVCTVPADLSVADDGSGDQILTCEPHIIENGDGAVSVQVENRFFAASQTWRQRFIFTNDGTSPVDGQVLSVNYSARQNLGTALSYTSSQGNVGNWSTQFDAIPEVNTTPADLTWVTDDRTNNEDAPVVKYAVGRLGSAVVLANDATRGFVSGGQGYSTVEDVHSNTNSYFELPSIAGGATVEIITLSQVFFFDDSITAVAPMNQWQTATLGAVNLAIADTALTSDAVVFAGVLDRSRVLNWSHAAETPPTPTAEPTLAATGTDGATRFECAGLAILIVTLGVGMLVARRRRASVQ